MLFPDQICRVDMFDAGGINRVDMLDRAEFNWKSVPSSITSGDSTEIDFVDIFEDE